MTTKSFSRWRLRLRRKPIGVAAAGVVTIGLVIVGAVPLASADPAATPSLGVTSPGSAGGSGDATVSGGERAKQVGAMTAKDSPVPYFTVNAHTGR